MPTHFLLPDCQVKPGLDLEYVRWAGEYAARRQPDVIINIGDFWDFPSLSSYDKGKKSFEGRRYKNDLDAGARAMDLFCEPLAKIPGYDPRMVFNRGNHEYRANRVSEIQPEYEGVIGPEDIDLASWGWEQYEYQVPVVIDGVRYCHMFVNPESLIKSSLTGTMDNRLRKLACSFTQGHQQGLMYGVKYAGGRVMHGLVAGSYYLHNEQYMGPQGNDHWRGLVVKHEVKDGGYDPMMVSIKYLKRKFGKKKGKRSKA